MWLKREEDAKSRTPNPMVQTVTWHPVSDPVPEELQTGTGWMTREAVRVNLLAAFKSEPTPKLAFFDKATGFFYENYFDGATFPTHWAEMPKRPESV